MVNVLEKQGNHKSKTDNRFTKTKRRDHKHNIKANHKNHKRKNKKKKKETKRKYKINEKTQFKMAINTYLSIITLKVNGLNAPIKRFRVVDWIKKKKKRAYNMRPIRVSL